MLLNIVAAVEIIITISYAQIIERSRHSKTTITTSPRTTILMASFDNRGCRGNDDDPTATATAISVSITCAVIITNKNSMVKTVALSVGDDDSGISGGDGR